MTKTLIEFMTCHITILNDVLIKFIKHTQNRCTMMHDHVDDIRELNQNYVWLK